MCFPNNKCLVKVIEYEQPLQVFLRPFYSFPCPIHVFIEHYFSVVFQLIYVANYYSHLYDEHAAFIHTLFSLVNNQGLSKESPNWLSVYNFNGCMCPAKAHVSVKLNLLLSSHWCKKYNGTPCFRCTCLFDSLQYLRFRHVDFGRVLNAYALLQWCSTCVISLYVHWFLIVK